MKTNENWAEIVDTLHPYLDGSREKERYLKDIGNCLRFLGWRKTNGTMVSCPPEDRSSGKPDIVLLKRGEDAGLQAFPVMTESPGEMVYAMGLYIGDNIRLYYNAPGEKGTPACVLTAEIRVDDANGPLLCDLLSFKGFNLKSMENFCLRRYNLVRTAEVSYNGRRIFFPEVPEREMSPACSGKNSWPKGSRNPLSGRSWTSSGSG